MKPKDNEANMQIIGSNETSRQYDQVHDNRSMLFSGIGHFMKLPKAA